MWAAALLGLLISGWALYLEPSSLGVRRYVIQVPEWSAANPALRIAVLGDLHVGSPFNDLVKLREIVELTNRQQPDLVLLAGDYVIQGVLGGAKVDPGKIASVLGRLQSATGVYAVLGNHDHWWDAESVAASLKRAGITVLEDQAVHLQRNGLDFWLVGISDFWEGEHDVMRALAPVPREDVIIAFTHNPDIFPEIPAESGSHRGRTYARRSGVPSSHRATDRTLRLWTALCCRGGRRRRTTSLRESGAGNQHSPSAFPGASRDFDCGNRIVSRSTFHVLPPTESSRRLACCCVVTVVPASVAFLVATVPRGM